MNNLKSYPWQRAYVSAVFETDESRLIRRISVARQAIERRLANPVEIDGPENLAIKAVWKEPRRMTWSVESKLYNKM